MVVLLALTSPESAEVMSVTHAKKKISTTEMIDNLKYAKSEYVVTGMHTQTKLVNVIA